MRHHFNRLLRSMGILGMLVMISGLGGGAWAAGHANGLQKRVIVYFPQWGIYNTAHQSMQVGQIPWGKVTAVNHAFMTVDTGYRLTSIDSEADFTRSFPHSTSALGGHFGEYKYYKQQYPDVRLFASVGGWTRGENFHAMAATASGRSTFAQSCVDFLNTYPFFDGIDIDWEYPGIDRAADPEDQYDKGCPGGPEDTENFTLLLKTLRETFDANGLSAKLLTIAAPAGVDKIALQHPDEYIQYLDYINLMTYDFHGAWENVTNHHCGLYANPDDPSPTTPVDIKNSYNTDFAMAYYRDTLGIPAEKLNIGTAFYSRGWSGVNASTGVNGLFATASGGATGSWDNPAVPAGQMPWFQLKGMENTGGYVKYWDDAAKAPYLYNASAGIMYSYVDEDALGLKCDYVNDNSLGGLIIWEISGDQAPDFPLTSLIYDRFGGSDPDGPDDPDDPDDPGDDTICDGVPAWSSGTVYWNGDQATYQGKLYQARWWTQGETPGQADVWTEIGACSDNPDPDDPDPVPDGFKVVGYIPDYKQVDVSAIQFDKLTHINYAFAIPTAGGTLLSLERPAQLSAIVSSAHANGVKVQIAVGGWSLNGTPLDGTFEALAANSAARATLVSSLMNLVAQYGLDGVDMDWEFPDPPQEGNGSAANFAALMEALASQLHAQGKILTAAVHAGATPDGNDNFYWAYGISDEVFPVVDFLNIMSYDGGDGERHSPYALAEGSLNYWVDRRGLPRAKAVLGVPFYGRPLWLAYNEIVAADPDAPNKDVANVNGSSVDYNGLATIKRKTDLAQARGGGIMIWELTQDTGDNTSLLRAVAEALQD